MTNNYATTSNDWYKQDCKNAKDTINAIFATPLTSRMSKKEQTGILDFICDKFDVNPIDLVNETYVSTNVPKR